MKADPNERAEVQAFRRCLADCAAASAAHQVAARSRTEDLSGSLTSLEELELASWRAQQTLEDATDDMNATDPSMIKIRTFLDDAVRAYVAASAAEPAPVLASVNDLEAHAAALVARGEREPLRRAAAARLAVAWATGHEAVALVVAERNRTSLPPAYIRNFSAPPWTFDETREWLNPKPQHYSGTRSQIDRLERLRREREEHANFENVRVLEGRGVTPSSRERVPRRSA